MAIFVKCELPNKTVMVGSLHKKKTVRDLKDALVAYNLGIDAGNQVALRVGEHFGVGVDLKVFFFLLRVVCFDRERESE